MALNKYYQDADESEEVEEEVIDVEQFEPEDEPLETVAHNGKKMYISEEVLQMLNAQIKVELTASQLYKAIASWCEYVGYTGSAKWFNNHVIEERKHMDKLYEYILDRQGCPITPSVDEQPYQFNDLKDVLEQTLLHEEYVESTYKEIMPYMLSNCFTTFTFLQFYLNEQIEEIKIVAGLLDRLEIIGYDQKGMFFLDKEIGEL